VCVHVHVLVVALLEPNFHSSLPFYLFSLQHTYACNDMRSRDRVRLTMQEMALILLVVSVHSVHRLGRTLVTV